MINNKPNNCLYTWTCGLYKLAFLLFLITGCNENSANKITVIKSQRNVEEHPEVIISPVEDQEADINTNKDIFKEITQSQEKRILNEVSLLPLVDLKHSTPSENYAITSNQEEIIEDIKSIIQSNSGHKKRPLRIVYFNPSDRKPLPGYQQRIRKIMTEIQNFYADGMHKNGFGSHTFDFEIESNSIKIHFIQSQKPKSHFSRTPEKAEEIKTEVSLFLKKQGIDINKETVIVFQNLATEGTNTFSDTDAPYFGSWNTNQNRSGFCYVVDSKYLDWVNLSKNNGKIIFNGQKTVTLGELASGQIGGICHELGHAFCLNHTSGSKIQCDKSGTALMGYGNWTFKEEFRNNGKGTFLSFASSVKLLGHPCFSPVKNSESNFQLINLSLNSMSSILEVHGKVRAHPDIYAVIAYCDNLNINSDYDASGWAGSIDKMGEFHLSINELEPSAAYQLNLQFLHVNGNESTEQVIIKTNESGIPEMDRESREKIILKPILKAKLSENKEKTATYIKALTSSNHERSINFLADSIKVMDLTPDKTPAQLSLDTKEIFLSQVKWTKAFTGYSSPRNNRVQEDNQNAPWPFLSSGDNIHRFGLYAHANSEYNYDLGGKWSLLSGKCALKNGMKGSVIFKITGDGKVLFNSGKVTDSKEKNYSVNISGVKTLKLLVSDNGDGKQNDWGLWLSPRLSR